MKTALYYIRTRCNYSQGMVARELDVSRQMLSAWENGTKTIPKARKEELAMLFGVPVEILEEQDGSTIRSYSYEIRSAVLLVHGERVHSRYFSEGAYEKLTGDNKELLIIPGASHVDLYDQTDVIPFEKLRSFFEEHLNSLRWRA